MYNQEYLKLLQNGDKLNDSQIEIIDQDRLCYLIKNKSRGACGIRTISKSIVLEFVNYMAVNPDASAQDAREALAGLTDNDKFEYGYTSSLTTMAKEVVKRLGSTSSRHRPFPHANNLLQQIFYGAPGTGKSYQIKRQTKGEAVVRTTFHPDTDYATFVGAYKPTTVTEPRYTAYGEKAVVIKDSDGHAIMEDKIVYEFVPQAFLHAYVEAWRKMSEAEPKAQYLVIEEINRGNCAQIFGDLFQLLDRSKHGFSEYPIKADKDMQRYLGKAFEHLQLADAEGLNVLFDGEDIADKVKRGEVLLLPSNLHIWATMNTSDQSLFPIDSAFKRRWDWQYMPISDAKKGWQIAVGEKRYDWWQFLTAINKEIDNTTHSEDKQLGYFFCKPSDGIISAETFVGKVLFYLWNDVFKDYEFDSPIFNDSDDGEKLAFRKFYTEDAEGVKVVEDKVVLFLANLKLEYKSLERDTLETIDEYTKYSINGNGAFSQRKLPYEVVSIYMKQHPSETAVDIATKWQATSAPVRMAVLTQDEYEEKHKLSKDVNFTNKYFSLLLANNEVIYVFNHYTKDRLEQFIDIVNQQDWGIHIETIEEQSDDGQEL